MAPEGTAPAAQGNTEPGGTDGAAAAGAAAGATGAAGADPAAAAAAAADPAATAAATAAAAAAPAGSDPAAGTATPAGAPDRYELTVPEADGFNSNFVQGDLDVFTANMRKAGATNEQAQAALDTLPASFAEETKRFRAELEAHPSLGGSQLEAVQQRAKRALDHFLPAGTPDGDRLRRVMTLTGYGNFAPWVAFVNAVGLAISEDRPNVTSTSVPGSLTKQPEDVLYGAADGSQ